MQKTILAILTLSLSTTAFSFSGYRGDDLTVTAGPTLASYNIRGSNGDDGARGAQGDRGRCSSSEGNIAGKDGDRGQAGEDGGDGGNLTVIFNKISDLKNILVDASGGWYGEGGPGGWGGDGCPNGETGPKGPEGSRGYTGSLYIVPATLLPYEPDSSAASVELSQLMKGKNLVKQLWSSFPGALNLLAPASDISDEYYRLDGYETGSAQVIFLDENMLDPRLLGDELKTSLKNNVATIGLSNEHVGMVTQVGTANHAVLKIERLYRKREFNSTTFGELTTSTLRLKTAVDLIPRPQLNLKLKLQLKINLFKYATIFDGEVPAELIEAVKAGYEINLEKLGLTKKISSGSKLKLNITYQLSELQLKSEEETEDWSIVVK